MKNLLPLFLFLLFNFSAKAQSLRSELIETTGSINSILSQNKGVRFINQEHNGYNLRKINANLNGDVFSVDSLTSDATKFNYKIFNLLEVKSFVSIENEIKVMDKNQKKIGKIVNVRNQDMQELIKKFDAVQFICITYSKLDPKFKCE